MPGTIERIGGWVPISLFRREAGIETPKETRPITATREVTKYQLQVDEFALPIEVESSLNEHQQRILDLSVEATRGIADLYLNQQRAPRDGFYPPKVRKDKILQAAKIDPTILSPYTIVEETEDGSLRSRPTHEVYADKLRRNGIIRLLRDAANEAGRGSERDFELQAYLRAKATALETGNFEYSERIWLERGDEPPIDIVIGLYDTYDDKLLGAKYSWQAWVGVLDRQTTHDVQEFKDAFLNWRQEQTGEAAPKVKMRVDHTRIMSGLAGKSDWVGNSLPCQPEWRARWGSKFIIFRPRFEEKFFGKQLPAFRTIIEPLKIPGITDSFARLAALRKYTAHEIVHALITWEGVNQRLQGEAAWVKELFCDLVGLTGYRQLGGLSFRESEIAMAMALVDTYLDYFDRANRQDHYKARTVFLNYLLGEGVVRIENGLLTWNDTQEVFGAIDNLRTHTEMILQNGKVKQARELRERYFHPEVYREIFFGRVI